MNSRLWWVALLVAVGMSYGLGATVYHLTPIPGDVEFGGNRAMEELLARHAERIAFAFCGHTHRARQGIWHGISGYNVGGDYHFKRLLWLNWPSGNITEHQFGDEAR